MPDRDASHTARDTEPFNPPYRYEPSVHGPVTIYDAVNVGWIARVKESLPHKEALAAAMVAGLNAAATQNDPLVSSQEVAQSRPDVAE